MGVVSYPFGRNCTLYVGYNVVGMMAWECYDIGREMIDERVRELEDVRCPACLSPIRLSFSIGLGT